MRFRWLWLLFLLAAPVFGQTGSWTVSVRPSSFAAEAGHALLADAAEGLVEDPPACAPPQFVRDMSASGALTCVTPEHATTADTATFATTAATATALATDPPAC